MKINKKIKTFEEYKNIDDIFSKEEQEATEVEDIKQTKEEEDQEKESEEEREMEEDEKEKIWGDENIVENFKTFESVHINKQFVLKDIKEFNKKIKDIDNKESFESLIKDTIISIIKNLGHKESQLNINLIMDHIGSSMYGELIPEDPYLIDEIIEILK